MRGRPSATRAPMQSSGEARHFGLASAIVGASLTIVAEWGSSILLINEPEEAKT